ncbi:MAG: hypothetical protein NC299_02845 [Lachnospiraceae bacterium]|nr:hypothetical protein [Ruminococcus sp.]MCM1274289.1 hypothetical protein [Lachnospiraceae bacterium]
MDSLVKTPTEISVILDSLFDQMDLISASIAEFCSVEDGKINDVMDDIRNLFEKHISINYRDINVFKKGKAAYPIRLSATDEEETKVETTAARSEPLQTKAAFFDSKKILYNQQSCEGLTIMWKRKTKGFFIEEYVPFFTGQENKTLLTKHSSAHNISSLETFLKNGGSFNREFYCPSDEEYMILREQYKNIFRQHKTAKGHGDSLEDLTLSLFNCCKHFSATKKIKLGDNQIDCFVRNKMYIPGVSQFGTDDFFVIECKNENAAPGISYFNKLHSILINNSLQFGIIVSKYCAAKTLNQFAHTIFLKDKIIMVNLDSRDLNKIINDRDNLLECLERKIGEIKPDVANNLREIGVFES